MSDTKVVTAFVAAGALLECVGSVPGPVRLRLVGSLGCEDLFAREFEIVLRDEDIPRLRAVAQEDETEGRRLRELLERARAERAGVVP